MDGLTIRPLQDRDIAWAEGLLRAAFGGRHQALVDTVERETGASRLWLVTTNDNLDALRFYQRRRFTISEVRLGAVEGARRSLKPTIPAVGRFGIPIRDEIILERRHSGATNTKE